MSSFPLTFKSKNFETYYRFHEDGRYEIVSRVKTKTGPMIKTAVSEYCVSNFSFGRFLEYPTQTKQEYMKLIASRHVAIIEREFMEMVEEIFNVGYTDFNSTFTIKNEAEPGERKTISFIDENQDQDDLTEINNSESEVDQVTREMRDENFKNGF